MLDHLVEENGLKPEFKRYGLGDRDMVFIKEVIAGPLKRYKEDCGSPELLTVSSVSGSHDCHMI